MNREAVMSTGKLTIRNALRKIIDFTLKNFWSPSVPIKEGDTITINFIAKTPNLRGEKSFKAKFIHLAKIGPLSKHKNVHVTELMLEEVSRPFFCRGRLIQCKNINTGKIWYEFTLDTDERKLPKFYSVTVEKTRKRREGVKLTYGGVTI